MCRRSSEPRRAGAAARTCRHEDYYDYHSYKVYPSGRRNVIEFDDTYKSFGPNQILRGLTMGLPRAWSR